MRNLKRVISLALAVVMVIGMMVVGAGAADFSDKAEIDYSEAVAVISGLGIIEGIANGDDTYRFNPDGILTREGAAKLICFMLMGPENAKLLTATQTFTDVKGWSAPFVSYCASLGYIAGNGDGTFNPGGKLTGLAFAKLLLCALGYDAEVEGYVNNKHWATRIAVDAYEAGLNIDGVDLYAQLTREQAAQMMLNTLSAPMVDYKTEVFGGTKHAYETGKTFAEVYFPNLTKFEGVVTANEYADLYYDDALKAGKTEIDGVIYNLSTDLTDIGESRQGWANGKNVLYIEDTGDNTVLSTGEATKIDTKFMKANGITANTEWYLNFGGEYTIWTCEYLLTYGYKDNKLDDGTAAPHGEVIVRSGKAIDVVALRAVFDDNNGYVYLGTKNTDDDYDFSSEMTWKNFVNTYLESEVDTDSISATSNGEWLKVVDNDGDGKADYVFVTEFAMTEVTSLTKKGVLTLDGKTYGGALDLPFVTSDELAKGDVVIYTIIDGACYVELAENFEATVKKYSYKDEIMTTTDGEEYAQSGIFNYTNYIYDDLEELDDETYIFYVDFFGYVRVAAEPAEAADDYVLVTEFYNKGANNDNLISTKELIAEVVDTEGKAAEYEVGTVKKAWDVDDTLLDDNKANNVESVAGTDSWTNVAAYALEDELISLDTAYNAVYNRKGEVIALTDYVALENAVTKGQKHFAIADAHDGEYINVTQNTLVFYVLGNAADEIDVVDVVTGYKNIVPVEGINAVYAIADRTDIDTEYDDYYWEAQILVIEAKDYVTSYKDTLAFVYSNPEKETTKVFSLENIAVDGALDVLYVENNFAAGQYVSDSVNPLAFYPTYEGEKGYDILKGEITENYAKWNIFAGEFKRYQESSKMDYIDVIIDGKVVSVDMPATAVAYTLSTGKGGTFDAAVLDLAERTNMGDKIIYVTDKYGEIVYIIDVTTSFEAAKTDSAIVAANKAAASKTLNDLWEDIEAEATAVAPVVDSKAVVATKALTALTEDSIKADVAAAESLVADAKALTTDDAKTAAEWQALIDAIAAAETLINTAKDEIQAAEDLEQAKADVINGINGLGWNQDMKDAAIAAVQEVTDVTMTADQLLVIGTDAAQKVLDVATAKTNAKAQLKTPVLADYSAEAAAQLPSKTEAEAAIDACATADEMAEIVTDYNNKVDAVPTYVEEQAAAKLTTAAGKVVNIKANPLNAGTIKTAIDTAIADGDVTVAVTDVVLYANSATCTVTLSTADAEDVVLKDVSVALDA